MDIGILVQVLLNIILIFCLYYLKDIIIDVIHCQNYFKSKLNVCINLKELAKKVFFLHLNYS